jgi:hypothetical protein
MVFWINSGTFIVTVVAHVLVSSQAVLAHPCSVTGFAKIFPGIFSIFSAFQRCSIIKSELP